MNVEKLLEVVLTTLEDSKAKDVTVLDVRGKTSMTDFMVVASGTSETVSYTHLTLPTNREV